MLAVCSLEDRGNLIGRLYIIGVQTLILFLKIENMSFLHLLIEMQDQSASSKVTKKSLFANMGEEICQRVDFILP